MYINVCMYVYIYACVLPASAYLTLSLALSPSLSVSLPRSLCYGFMLLHGDQCPVLACCSYLPTQEDPVFIQVLCAAGMRVSGRQQTLVLRSSQIDDARASFGHRGSPAAQPSLRGCIVCEASLVKFMCSGVGLTGRSLESTLHRSEGQRWKQVPLRLRQAALAGRRVWGLGV